MKLKKDGTPRKAGSGRTKGSVSLVSVRMSDLQARFKPEDLIVAGRIFLEKAGVPSAGPALSDPTPKEGIKIVSV